MRRPDRVLRQHLRSRFLITTLSGQSWDGVVLDLDESSLVLVDVESVDTDGQRSTAAGQIIIRRADIAYMQRT